MYMYINIYIYIYIYLCDHSIQVLVCDFGCLHFDWFQKPSMRFWWKGMRFWMKASM